ncbi:D-aminoacid aminotransferase-like PLP-dependent enzymes superfamily protein [Rhynchospora pubera]|uniref:D-aminoacid aminotransferase-like PLP-dependent enzymes superfamily protein n=1 Tax=Rhynchospora pubera TaxID=906938 RepID=A0AAV8EEP0_9POAL|nr:D-aminoacid aminotransferase-like PLP-dependent enzymes superfamily protein [Rhynchospora pubera]
MAAYSSSCCSGRFLLINGVPRTGDGDVPPVASFLESTSGAYTTTRTHGSASCVLFWDRHLTRLTESVRILAQARPHLLGPGPMPAPNQPPLNISSLAKSVNHSLKIGFRLAYDERSRYGLNHELAITALVTRKQGADWLFDVFLHIGFYAPPVFGSSGACLAVAGPGRDLALAKYSDWVRIRKGLEKMKPPNATELLLSNNGDELLEGSVTNFFVVCKVADNSSAPSTSSYRIEVQTAPVRHGVLPGIVRQLVLEICSDKGIPLREIAPSWSERNLWEEAFITSSLRIVQHVDSVQASASYKDLQLKTWEDVSWILKHFEGPGPITTLIQKEIMARADREVCQME